MKNIFSLKNLSIGFLIMFCIFWTRMSYAQVGTTGSWGPDYEVIQKCVDSANLGTNYISYYEIATVRAGQTTVYATYRSNGSTFTPPTGKIIIGSCPASVTVTPDSIRSIGIIPLCDLSGSTATPFYRIVQRVYWPSGGAGTVNILSTIGTNGAPYTVTGTVQDGPCFLYSTTTAHNRSNISGSITYAGPWESWEVENVGTAIGTITLNSTATDLYPGEVVGCKTWTDPVTKIVHKCPSIIVNSNGTTFNVIRR